MKNVSFFQVMGSYLTSIPSMLRLWLCDGKSKLFAFLFLKKGQSEPDLPTQMAIIRLERMKPFLVKQAGKILLKFKIENYRLLFKGLSGPARKLKKVSKDVSRMPIRI